MATYLLIQKTIIPEGWEPKPEQKFTHPKEANDYVKKFKSWFFKYHDWCHHVKTENIYLKK
jgi:hypothetical protein